MASHVWGSHLCPFSPSGQLGGASFGSLASWALECAEGQFHPTARCEPHELIPTASPSFLSPFSQIILIFSQLIYSSESTKSTFFIHSSIYPTVIH